MSGWLIGIVSAIVATTLIDVIMAEGETKRFVKGIAALLVLVAIITPLPTLLGKDFTIDSGDTITGGSGTNNEYLARIYAEKYLKSKLAIQNALKLKGINGVVVTINYTYDGLAPKINDITADVSNVIITSENKNIDINKTVTETIVAMLKEQRIIIIGGK